MWLVNREDVGAVAYGRLHRDGAIRTLIPGVALPGDVPDSPAVRRHILSQWFPSGCQVTGLGVLWVHGHAAFPTELDIRTPKGRHVRNWHGSIPLTYHAVGALTGDLSDDHKDNAFAELATAIVDALRWAPRDLAVPATVSALTQASEASRTQLAADVSAQVTGSAHARATWAAVRDVMTNTA